MRGGLRPPAPACPAASHAPSTSENRDERLFRRVLEGREQQLGARHPSTLIAANNLAMLLRAQGKLSEAEPLCRRALEGIEQQLGALHAHTLLVVNSLALLLEAQGRLSEAEPLYRRALEGQEQQLSAHHPSTLIAVHNLAGLLQAQGKLSEAEPLRRRYASSREVAASRCAGCGTLHNLKKCAKCHVARFCSTACITAAWPAHKPNCKLWQNAGT